MPPETSDKAAHFDAPHAAARRGARARGRRLLLSAALAFACAACAAGSRDPEVARPRADAPPYPVLLASSEERRAQAAANWLALAHAQSTPQAVAQGTSQAVAQPEFQPVTSTVRALPPVVPEALRLPLVQLGEGEGADPEEATRESLRRFIAGARELLGVDPEDLSLTETREEAGGAKLARYVQKPFPFPLRNGFGLVEIRFAPDRRVLSLSSTAVPDTERLAAALTALRPNLLPAADIPARLAGRPFDYAAQGATQTFAVSAGDAVDVRELVVFPVARANDPATLEIRLAWETVVGRGATNLLAYVDAVTGETLSAAPTAETPRPSPSATPPPTPAPTETPRAATPTPAPSPAASPAPPAATPTPRSSPTPPPASGAPAAPAASPPA